MHRVKNLLGRLFKPRRIYLDYAAATPVALEVWAAMEPYFSVAYVNAGAIHREGVGVRKAIDAARKDIADTLKIRADDVVFTSGGTESNHLAIVGLIDALHHDGKAYEDMEVISSRIEHPSVLESLKVLESRGVIVRYVPTDSDGLIAHSVLAAHLSPKTVLIVLTYVNSEIGVVQDVKRLARTVRAYERERTTRIFMHLDACQAPLWLSCEMDMLGVDLMSLDAGKCYGPKGVGVLARRHRVPLRTQLPGGGQEGGLRSGTENTPLIIGCATALVRAQKQWKERSARAEVLRDLFFQELTTRISGVVVNGPLRARVANNINVSVPGIDAEFAVITLDAKGIAASTKSACATARGNGSAVVLAISGDEARAASTVRFTLGEETTEAEVRRAAQTLAEHVEAMRAFADTRTKN